MNKQTTENQAAIREEFLGIGSMQELCYKLQTDPRRLNLTIQEPKYKTFTVLVLKEKVELAQDYLPSLHADIAQLTGIFRAQNHHGELHTPWAEKQKQQVFGRIAFAGFILGKRNETYIDLKSSYYAAINPPEEEFGAVSWWGFPYNF